jgi:hypothetical protein
MKPVKQGWKTYPIAARALTEEPFHCRSVSSSVALCCMEESLEIEGPIAERGGHEKREEEYEMRGEMGREEVRRGQIKAR